MKPKVKEIESKKINPKTELESIKKQYQKSLDNTVKLRYEFEKEIDLQKRCLGAIEILEKIINSEE
jgi:ABC-type Fe3+-citrate transport system substrate-binding protein